MIAWICSFSGIILVLALTMPHVIDGLLNRNKPLSPESLHGAAHWGLHKQVLTLLNQGNSPNVQDDKGNTPLHYALHYGHVEVVKLLLESDANLHCLNHEGKTPLDQLETALSKKRIDEATYSACKVIMEEHTSE